LTKFFIFLQIQLMSFVYASFLLCVFPFWHQEVSFYDSCVLCVWFMSRCYDCFLAIAYWYLQYPICMDFSYYACLHIFRK
jgi:hypothetical protein